MKHLCLILQVGQLRSLEFINFLYFLQLTPPRPSQLEHIGEAIFDIPFIIQSHGDSMKKILDSMKKILGAIYDLPLVVPAN